MALAALGTLYCSETDIAAILSQEGIDLRLDDDMDELVSASELAYLTTQGISWATEQVESYVGKIYDVAQLATSWSVNEWTAILAARFLCSRRGNAVPASLEKRKEEVIQDLKEIASGERVIPKLQKRNADWPAWSSVTVDPTYLSRKIRIQRPESERTPPQYPRKNIDWIAEALQYEF